MELDSGDVDEDPTSVNGQLKPNAGTDLEANNGKQRPIELRNTTNLHDINDDCLLQIFEVKSLTLMDLCSLAETCRRFQQISQRVFPKNLSIKYYGCYDICSRKFLRSNKRPSEDIKRIFKNFGSFVSELSIAHCPGYLQRFFVNLVAEYCADTLESLRMRFLEDSELFTELQVDDLFPGYDSLFPIEQYSVKNCGAILENTFSKLKRFSFTYKCALDERNWQLLSTFISRHTSLKLFTFYYFGYRAQDGGQQRSNLLRVIVDSCKELEEVVLDLDSEMNASALHPLQAAQSLKILKLCRANCEDLKFIASLRHLRELHLICCILPTDSKQFAALAQLTKLHIKEGSRTGPIDVVGIVIQLVNLEELQVPNALGNGFILDEKTFLKIVDIVKGRPNVLTLKCECENKFENPSHDVDIVAVDVPKRRGY